MKNDIKAILGIIPAIIFLFFMITGIAFLFKVCIDFWSSIL